MEQLAIYDELKGKIQQRYPALVEYNQQSEVYRRRYSNPSASGVLNLIEQIKGIAHYLNLDDSCKQFLAELRGEAE